MDHRSSQHSLTKRTAVLNMFFFLNGFNIQYILIIRKTLNHLNPKWLTKNLCTNFSPLWKLRSNDYAADGTSFLAFSQKRRTTESWFQALAAANAFDVRCLSKTPSSIVRRAVKLKDVAHLIRFWVIECFIQSGNQRTKENARKTVYLRGRLPVLVSV